MPLPSPGVLRYFGAIFGVDCDMAHHVVLCSRIRDILDHRQTVLHIIPEGDVSVAVGDSMLLVGHPRSPRGVPAIVTGVSKHRLYEVLDADLPRLGCCRMKYLDSWNRTNPGMPHEVNPEIVRIELCYQHAS